MDHALSRIVTTSALAVFAGVLSVAACTHNNERVVEPVGGADASAPTPEVTDAGVSPIGPIANPVELEPREDFRLVRAPEFGNVRDRARVTTAVDRQAGVGGFNAGGSGGIAGSDLRPVAAAGGTYY